MTRKDCPVGLCFPKSQRKLAPTGLARGVQKKRDMIRRSGIYLLVTLSIVVGAAMVTDAIVVTDRERMDDFIESVTGDVSSSRIDGALSYADPAKVPFELVHDGRRRKYGDRNASALKSDARKALASLEGSKLRLIQESVSLQGKSARIALRVRTNSGLANTVFDLRREDDEWLLRRVIVN